MALGVVLGLLVIAVLPGIADLIARRAALATTTGGSGRIDIWTVGIAMFSSAPWTGVGLGNFPVAYTPAFVATVGGNLAVGSDRAPHSILIGTMGELGLVGFVCLVLFLVPLTLRRGWGPDATVVQAIMASLMISALFLDVLDNRKQVWLAIGLAAGLRYVAEARTKAAKPSGAKDASEDLGHAAEPTSLPRASPTRQAYSPATRGHVG